MSFVSPFLPAGFSDTSSRSVQIPLRKHRYQCDFILLHNALVYHVLGDDEAIIAYLIELVAYVLAFRIEELHYDSCVLRSPDCGHEIAVSRDKNRFVNLV